MRVKNNTIIRGFSEAWDLLPGGKQKEVREEIQQKCGWRSRMTFYNKRNGSFTVTYPELVVIKGIFEAYNIDIETGEYIKQLV